MRITRVAVSGVEENSERPRAKREPTERYSLEADAPAGKRWLHRIFHVGSNSSCRQHIRGHYKVYQERCKEENLYENQHAVPRDLLRAREKEKREKKAG